MPSRLAWSLTKESARKPELPAVSFWPVKRAFRAATLMSAAVSALPVPENADATPTRAKKPLLEADRVGHREGELAGARLVGDVLPRDVRVVLPAEATSDACLHAEHDRREHDPLLREDLLGGARQQAEVAVAGEPGQRRGCRPC